MESQYQSFIFSYQITDTHLKFKLFRIVTLGWVKLVNISALRGANTFSIWEWVGDLVMRPFKHWFWPTTSTAKDAHPFVIKTKNNKKILVRLGAGYHYKLRTAINEARIA